MGGLTCPACGATLDPQAFVIADRLGVCPSCARSVVYEPAVPGGRDERGRFRPSSSDTVRLATGADLAGVSGAEVAELRRQRPTAWRQATQARLNQILASKG